MESDGPAFVEMRPMKREMPAAARGLPSMPESVLIPWRWSIANEANRRILSFMGKEARNEPQTPQARANHQPTSRSGSWPVPGWDGRRNLPLSGDLGAELGAELLNGEIFYTLKEAQVLIEQWRHHYTNAMANKPNILIKPTSGSGAQRNRRP